MTPPVSVKPPTYRIQTHADYEANASISVSTGDANSRMWESEEGMGFLDFLDIINPLQHIPIVSTIYRALTGDEIGLAPRLAGGLLFNGPAGLLFAGVSAAFEDATGGDTSDHLVALVRDLTGEDEAAEPQLAIAGLESRSASGTEALPAAAAALEPAAGVQAPGLQRNAGAVPSDISDEPADARIRRRIEEAQKAQAGLLLASLKAGDARFAAVGGTAPDTDGKTASRRDEPGRPPDTETDWFAQAMKRGLDKYRQSQALHHAPGAR